MMILGIDPGTEISHSALLLDRKIKECWSLKNDEMKAYIANIQAHYTVIEKINIWGSAGNEVSETLIWIGRFIEQTAFPAETLKRKTIASICTGSTRSGDSQIRAAMVNYWGKKGTKKSPGNTYGIVKDQWQALAVATAFGWENRLLSTETREK